MTGDPFSNLVLLLEAKLAADAAVVKLVNEACAGDAAAAAGLLEAIGLLRQIANLADGLAPGQEADVSGAALAAQAARVRAQLASLQEHKFKTNDIVSLRGAVEGERTLQISGLSLSLGQRSFLVLRILFRMAQTNPGAYLSVNEIVNAVMEDPTRQKAGIWEYPVPVEVHRVISGIRERIQDAGGNPRLIELSCSYGAGYRLSTPYWNVILEDLDQE